MANRTPRLLTKDETEWLLRLTPEDLTKSFFRNNFAYTKKGSPKYLPNDKFVLDKGRYYNKENITTTVGRYLVTNLFLLTPNLIKVMGYQDLVLDGDGKKKIENTMAQLLMEDKIECNDYIEYLNRVQWIGFSLNTLFAPSLSYEITNPLKEVEKRKQEIIKEKRDKLAEGDLVTANNMEKELLSLAKSKVEKMDAYNIYASGARGSFGNNYKNASVMRGPIESITQPGKFFISTTNLVDGIDKAEFPHYCNLLVSGAYQRAVATQIGGYESKKLNAALQSIMLDELESDCHTKKSLTITLTPDIIKQFIYRYVIEGQRLVLLTSENIKSYVDKTVKIRSPLYCLNDKLCSKCAGELFYKLGIENLGLTANKVGTTLLQLSLKASHDSTIKVTKIDINKYITMM